MESLIIIDETGKWYVLRDQHNGYHRTHRKVINWLTVDIPRSIGAQIKLNDYDNTVFNRR